MYITRRAYETQPYDMTTDTYTGLLHTEQMEFEEVQDCNGNIIRIPMYPPDLGASVDQEEKLIKACENIIEFYDSRYLNIVADSSLDPDLKQHYLRRANYEKWLAICHYVRSTAPAEW